MCPNNPTFPSLQSSFFCLSLHVFYFYKMNRRYLNSFISSISCPFSLIICWFQTSFLISYICTISYFTLLLKLNFLLSQTVLTCFFSYFMKNKRASVMLYSLMELRNSSQGVGHNKKFLSYLVLCMQSLHLITLSFLFHTFPSHIPLVYLLSHIPLLYPSNFKDGHPFIIPPVFITSLIHSVSCNNCKCGKHQLNN